MREKCQQKNGNHYFFRHENRNFFRVIIGICVTITASWFLWISTTTMENNKEVAVIKIMLLRLEKWQEQNSEKLDRMGEKQTELLALILNSGIRKEDKK